MGQQIQGQSEYLNVGIMVAGVGCDVVCVVVVLPPLHPGPQEQRHKDAHDRIGTARLEELVVANIMAHQGQLQARYGIVSNTGVCTETKANPRL